MALVSPCTRFGKHRSFACCASPAAIRSQSADDFTSRSFYLSNSTTKEDAFWYVLAQTTAYHFGRVLTNLSTASKDNIEAQNVAANHTISFRLKTGARLFYGILTCVSMLSFLFAFALLVPHCGASRSLPLELRRVTPSNRAIVAGFPSMPDQELVHAEHIVSEAAHELARRGDSKDNTVAYDPSAKVLAATAGTIAVERSTVTPYLTLTASSASAYFTTSSVSIMTPSLDDRGHTGGVTIPVS